MVIHNVSLLHYNHEPDQRVKDASNGCFLQICALNRFDNRRQLETLIDETSDDTEMILGAATSTSLSQLHSLAGPVSAQYEFFYFDRPFYLNSWSQPHSSPVVDNVIGSDGAAKVESVENLWIERTILVQVHKCHVF